MIDFSSPTPLASALSSLAFVCIIALLYTFVLLVRRKKEKKAGTSIFERLISGVRWLDRSLVHLFSWVTGTRYRKKYIRVPIILFHFLGLTAAGVFLSWPYSMGFIALGVFSIFIVFRHWSRDENEAVAGISYERKDLKIDGTLGIEVMISVAFLFVLVPTAFAQLQAQGIGFKLDSDAGPFAFLIYTLIETIKAGSLVDYYDLYAGQIGFEKVGAPTDPTNWAKATILIYRISLNLLALAAIKRLLDIAKRRAEGADLRALAEALRQTDADKQIEAIAKLKDFALQGRGNARDMLESVAEPRQSELLPIDPETRFAASSALLDYGVQRGGASALYAAADGFRALKRNGFDPKVHPQKCRAAVHNLGNTLVQLGQQIGDPERLKEAAAIYQELIKETELEVSDISRLKTMIAAANVSADLAMMTGKREDLEEAVNLYALALEHADKDKHQNQIAILNTNLGATLADIAEINSEEEIISQAIAAYNAALGYLSPSEDQETWSMAQNNLGNALADLGHWTSDSAQLEASILAHEQALSERKKNQAPHLWAMSQMNLANALTRLGKLESDADRLHEAIEHYQAAQSIYQREEFPRDWSWAEASLASAHIDRGYMMSDATEFEKAIVYCDGAIGGYASAKMPLREAWAFGLKGNALVALERFEEAAEAFKSALMRQSYENAGDDWVMSSNNLAACQFKLGREEEALKTIKNALQILPDDPRFMATLQAINGDKTSETQCSSVDSDSQMPINNAEAETKYYQVSIQRICGEFVIGHVSPEFFQYWKGRDDLENEALNWGDPDAIDPNSPSPHVDGRECEGWYAVDDIVHLNNAVFESNTIYVDQVTPDEDSYSGFAPLPDGYSEEFVIDEIRQDMPEGFCEITKEWEVDTDLDDVPAAPVFVGKSIEKGAQTDVYITTESDFDLSKLKFEVWHIDGDNVIAFISYNGTELEIIPDSSSGRAFYAYLGQLE